MIDINDIIKNLKAGMKITHDLEFLRKYDNVVQNSIFEQEEIDMLKTDLVEFAKRDGYEEGLSNEEMGYFYDNAMNNEENTSFAYSPGVKTVKGWLNSVTGENKKILNELNKSQIFKNFSSIQKQFVTLIVKNHLKFGNLFLGEIDKFLNDNFVNSQYSDEEIEQILPKLTEFNKIPTFSFENLKKEDFLKLKDIDINRVNYIMDNNLYHYKDTVKFQSIALCDNDTFEKAKPFLNIPKFGMELDEYTIKQLLNVSDGYEKLINIISTRKEEKLHNWIPLVTLPDEQYENIKELMNKQILFQDGQKNILSSNQLVLLANVPQETQNIILELMHIEGRDINNQLNISTAKQIAQIASEDIFNFIKENPNFKISYNNSNNETYTSLKKNNKGNNIYRFDEKGLLETYSKYTDNETGETKVEIYNHQNKIKQETIYEKEKSKHIFSGDETNDIKSEKLTYYNDDGSIKKIINIKKSTLVGLPNQSVTYADGRVEPTQFATYDPISGARNVEKHFISPAGTKTDYYYEETPDNTRIINYKITDKNGNVLLNRTNTFQQISEKQFISSVNGRIFEIEFQENNIKITDKQTQKEHIIDLDKRIENKEHMQVIINILKVVPGNQLIMMNHIPLNKLFYSDFNKNDAAWYPESRAIGVGARDEYSTSEIESLQSVFMHEYGHYLDSAIETGDTHVISDDKRLNDLFQKEYALFTQYTTTEQHKYMTHLLDDGRTEATAESNMLLYSQEPVHNMRAMYYQMFFPETIARMAKLITERENSFLNA